MPKIRDEYMVNLKGKMHPVYAGVLVAAHENGLLGIEVSVLQYPAADNGNTAVCAAMVTMKGEDGRELVFQEVGDANPGNVGSHIAPHIIRMAATRAKGRALRDALALGIALVEEMGPDSDSEPANGHRGAPQQRPAQQRAKHDPQDHAERAAAPEAPSAMCEQCGAPVLPDTATAARKRWGVVLCLEDGKARIHADKAAANGTPAQLQGA